MGVPFLGETLSLLWYFKHAHRPDEFISAKKTAYGKAAGMYRTHLFGSPTIIACTPAANKFVLQSPENFGVHWPEPELRCQRGRRHPHQAPWVHPRRHQ
jgi:ent-kaurenoic acid hydroxylase